MNSLKSQLIKLLGFAVAILVLIIILDNLPFTQGAVHQRVYEIYTYLTVVSFILSVGTFFIMQNSAQDSWTGLFMGVMVARLLFTAGYIGIVLYLGVEGRLQWVINVFIIYLLYMMFEIVGLIANLRAISQEAG
ncbi:hypothetical protein BXY85_1875 [Roseivirga pacifica]|uniref:Uncharacterized protein n=1 Tax=Roseivirga pacifica TaxID=1267423 RepID=A0A1I0N1W8_9BACT|nr:hypothetical protein [Roseivirga pacifica]MCO6359388.1 hypothetical protein [Roseivirga pacifica]MCO6366758.1 hypothetical protein [Roseivirga pacifica]MCO6370710.1 hypothetical protein [Roseivirga pacifica]MCO6374414.1 hypothetical protein [Roseivirga pacifica]MCO6379673.1 hypothetical protein [Roseivirga pacifica]